MRLAALHCREAGRVDQTHPNLEGNTKLPNHETNYVVVVGDAEKIDRFVLEAFTEEGLEFNRIIPRPPELNDTISPPTIVATEAEAEKINAEYKPHAFSGDQTIKAITEDEAARRQREYGSVDWYDWSLRNWGTKWGCYEQRDMVRNTLDNGAVTLRLVFETAWSAPTPIFKKIEERWDVKVAAVTIDEGGFPPVHYGDAGLYLSTTLAVDFQ